MESLLDWARYYASKGFSLIPLRPNDKRPAIDSWKKFQERHATDQELLQWFGDGSNINIGIVTGGISGIDVVDLDGREALDLFLKLNSKKTPVVSTGKGLHFYFCHKVGVRNFQKREDLPGIDLRGDGGYVVAPPSVHPNGKTYAWVTWSGLDDLPLADFPEGLITKEVSDKTPLKELYKGVLEGARNDTLAKLCGSWASDKLSIEECLDLALVWNSKNSPPLPEKEVTRTVQSIFEKEVRKAPPGVAKPDKKQISYQLSTLEDIFNYPEPSYLVDEIFIEGTVNILGGYTGVGKSIVVLSMVKSILTGEPLWGKYPVLKKGPVLIVDEETPRGFLRERVEKMGFDKNLPLYFLHFQDVQLDEGNRFNALKEIIAEVQPVFVVIDSLIRVHRKKEDDAMAMSQVIAKMREIANAGTTLLVIHHHKKGEGPINQRLRGSSDIAGGIDIEYALVAKEDFLTFSSVKTRTKPFYPVKLEMVANDEEIGISYQGIEAREKDAVREEVVNIILGEEEKEFGVEEISDALEKSGFNSGINSLRAILNKAVKDKVLAVRKAARGKRIYSVDPASQVPAYLNTDKTVNLKKNGMPGFMGNFSGVDITPEAHVIDEKSL